METTLHEERCSKGKAKRKASGTKAGSVCVSDLLGSTFSINSFYEIGICTQKVVIVFLYWSKAHKR